MRGAGVPGARGVAAGPVLRPGPSPPLHRCRRGTVVVAEMLRSSRRMVRMMDVDASAVGSMQFDGPLSVPCAKHPNDRINRSILDISVP